MCGRFWVEQNQFLYLVRFSFVYGYIIFAVYSEQAIGWLEYCGAQLVHGSYTSTSKQYADLWLALLNGLSRIVSHKASEVRTRYVDVCSVGLVMTYILALWRRCSTNSHPTVARLTKIYGGKLYCG